MYWKTIAKLNFCRALAYFIFEMFLRCMFSNRVLLLSAVILFVQMDDCNSCLLFSVILAEEETSFLHRFA